MTANETIEVEAAIKAVADRLGVEISRLNNENVALREVLAEVKASCRDGCPCAEIVREALKL